MSLVSFAVFRTSAFPPSYGIDNISGISGECVKTSVGVPTISVAILLTSSATQSHGFSGGIFRGVFRPDGVTTNTCTFGLTVMQDRNDVTSQGQAYGIELHMQSTARSLRIVKFSAGIASTGQQTIRLSTGYSFVANMPYALQARWFADPVGLNGVYLEGSVASGTSFGSFSTIVCAVDTGAPFFSAVNEGAFGRTIAAGGAGWQLLLDDLQCFVSTP